MIETRRDYEDAYLLVADRREALYFTLIGDELSIYFATRAFVRSSLVRSLRDEQTGRFRAVSHTQVAAK